MINNPHRTIRDQRRTIGTMAHMLKKLQSIADTNRARVEWLEEENRNLQKENDLNRRLLKEKNELIQKMSKAGHDEVVKLQKELQSAQQEIAGYVKRAVAKEVELSLCRASLQSVRHCNEKLIEGLRSIDSEIENSIDLLQEDYFENWDESVQILFSSRKSISATLKELGKQQEG